MHGSAPWATTSSADYAQTQPADKVRILLEISNRLSKTLEIDALLALVVERLPLRNVAHTRRQPQNCVTLAPG